MKVLINAISAKKGGIVTYTQNLLSQLDALGIDALFAVPKEFPYQAKNLIRIESARFPVLTRALWEQTVWRRLVAKIKPTVLYSSANYGLFRSPVPQVLLIREGGLLDPFYLQNIAPELGVTAAAIRLLRRRLILSSASWSDIIITPTEATKQLILKWQPGLASKLRVCHYGTPIDIFRTAREREWCADGVLRLIYVSVYYPHKTPGILCEAVRLLNEQGTRAHATLTVSLEELRQVNGAALDHHQLSLAFQRGEVTLGRRTYLELPRLYSNHDVFVFPSISETFGHPMAEAMSIGIPVVAADTPVNREVCGDAALYFRPFSPNDLASCLRRLGADPTLRGRMVAAGFARVERMFRWDHHVSQLVDILREVSSPTRHANS